MLEIEKTHIRGSNPFVITGYLTTGERIRKFILNRGDYIPGNKPEWDF